MDDLNVDGSLFLRRRSRGQLIVLDALAGAAYAIVLLTFAAARPVAEVPLWAQSLLVAVTGPALALRRLWPLPMFVLAFGTSLASLLLGLVHDGFAAAAFALYLVALTRPRPRWEPTVTIGVGSAAAVVMLSVAGSPDPGWWLRLLGALLPCVALLGGTWTVGRAVRERRAYAARSAEQLADRAVTEERLRIAREMHDVVAHSMSLIAVKAGIANHVAQARPEEARDALRVIEATSRGALTELRHLLGVMRSGTEPDTVSGLSPAPDLAGLPGLADRAALAGVRVELDVTAAALPEGVGLSVYRIVQEALTNVVRHAAPARCRVLVEADGREVRIEVTDDGPGHRVLPGQPGQPGHGLAGIRERVLMYGGSFAAGRRPEGGFGVSARLPYGGSTPYGGPGGRTA
ncbi:sensor histidine kinase [Streptosporangium canum]|uniref:sensor histidine kinase n=1 Tax=Streptosporangium canum TaxID=324952 RepID=UPI0033B593C4